MATKRKLKKNDRRRIRWQDVPDGWWPVVDAAWRIRLTRQAIYQAIKRGDLKAKKFRGFIIVEDKSLIAHHRKLVEALNPKPKKKRPLTDAEFLQQLIDNDPD